MYEIVFEPSDLNMLAAIGIIEKAKLFPYLLSMGDLRHPCDSCYRCEQFIKCLSEYCTDCKSQAKKLWEKRITENTTLSMESVQWMAQRINSLLEYMQYGYALIAYRKQDGSFYMGRGTLVSYESDFKKKHDMTSIKAHVAYWDAEQQGWRTFLIENFMEWRPIVN